MAAIITSSNNIPVQYDEMWVRAMHRISSVLFYKYSLDHHLSNSFTFKSPIMPPKKEVNGKKKKEVASGELSPEDQIKMLKFTIDSLQIQLADRSEETSRAIHSKDQVTERLEDLSKSLEDEKESKLDLLQSMTRQINEMEIEFLTKLTIKEEEITQINEKTQEIQQKLHDEIKLKESFIDEKDIDIKRLQDELINQRKEFNASLQV